MEEEPEGDAEDESRYGCGRWAWGRGRSRGEGEQGQEEKAGQAAEEEREVVPTIMKEAVAWKVMASAMGGRKVLVTEAKA